MSRTIENFFIHIEPKPQNEFIIFREVDVIPKVPIQELERPWVAEVGKEDLEKIFESFKDLAFGQVLGKFRFILKVSRSKLAERWKISYATLRDLEDFSDQRSFIRADVYSKILNGVEKDLGKEAAQFLSERIASTLAKNRGGIHKTS